MDTAKAIQLLHRISDSQFDGQHGDERREALKMAVRALSGDGDTISRKMAIDAVVSAMIDGADAELVEGVMELLPSAQPHWILCSERMPETEYGESDNVLTTCIYKDAVDGYRSVKTLYYNGGVWCYPTGETFEGKVLAWMPLPKPYGGENE